MLRALNFKGSANNQSIDMQANAAWNNLTKFSVGLLHKNVSVVNKEAGLLTKVGALQTNGWTVSHTGTVSSEIQVQTFGWSTSDMSYTTNTVNAFPTGIWCFAVITVDFGGTAGQKVKFYVNGAGTGVPAVAGHYEDPLVLAEYSQSTDQVGTQANDSANVVQLGSNWDGQGENLDGPLAIMFFCPGIVLSTWEANEWKRSPMRPPRGCQGFWLPGSEDRGLVQDRSGYGNYGTIVGSPTPISDVPQFAQPFLLDEMFMVAGVASVRPTAAVVGQAIQRSTM
jgi:hypothetical protein